MEIHNTSGMFTEVFEGKTIHDDEIALLLVKATYTLEDDGSLHLSNPQDSFEFADVFVGAPGESSLYYTSDICFNKIATDIAATGTVSMDENEEGQIVSLKAGAVEKHLALFHQREWTGAAGLYRQKISAVVDEIPLNYEYAFGGEDTTHAKDKNHNIEVRNPVGLGYTADKTGKKIAGEPLPFIEDLTDLMKRPKDKPAPAGFGFIAPSWSPRSELAGTLVEESTTLPIDMDIRFFNAAHPDLIYPGFLPEDVPVEIKGMRKNTILFSVPPCPSATYQKHSEDEDVPAPQTPVEMNTDKLFINIDDNKIILLWRGIISQEEFQSIEAISIE